MAYSFASASSQYLNTTTSPISDVPMTLAIWTRDDRLAVYSTLFIQNTTNSNRHGIFNRGNPENLVQISSVGPSPVSANTTATYTADVYKHAAAVLASTASRTIFFNGGNSATNTTTVSATGLNQISIGARYSGSYGAFFNGQAAEAAIWNTNLTAAEVASLSKGFKPCRIRPQSLVFYAPLIRNLQDIKGARAITNNNTATVANHPRVY